MEQELVARYIEKARDGTLEVGELLLAGEVLAAAGDLEATRALHLAWFEGNPTHQLNFAVCYNYGALLMRLRDPAGAKAVLEEAIRLNPDYMASYVNLGAVLEHHEGQEAALTQWMRVPQLLPQVTSDNIHSLKVAFAMAGRVLEEQRRHAEAEEAFRRSLDLDLDQPEVLQHYLSLIQQQCKWPIINPWYSARGVTHRDLLKDINPLTLAMHSDDPLFQLGNCFHYANKKAGHPGHSFLDRHAEIGRAHV